MSEDERGWSDADKKRDDDKLGVVEILCMHLFMLGKFSRAAMDALVNNRGERQLTTPVVMGELVAGRPRIVEPCLALTRLWVKDMFLVRRVKRMV